MPAYPQIPWSQSTRVSFDDGISIDLGDDATVRNSVLFGKTLVTATIVHDAVTTTDRNTLLDFYSSEKRSIVFVKYAGVVYGLYFVEPPDVQYLEGGWWRVEITLRGNLALDRIYHTLAAPTQSASGSVLDTTHLATMWQLIPRATQSGAGSARDDSREGGASQECAAITQDAAGDVNTPADTSREGTISQTLAAATQDASGSVGVTKTNLVFDSRDLTSTWWLATATRAFNQTGIGGAANTATLLSDTSTASEYAYMGVRNHGGDTSNWTARVYIKKNSGGDPPYPQIAIVFGTSTSPFAGTNDWYSIRVDTSDGSADEFDTEVSGSYNVSSYDANWWEIKLQAPNTNSRAYAVLVLHPAAATTLTGSMDATQQDSIIVGNCELYYDRTMSQITGEPVYVKQSVRFDGSDAAASGTNWTSLTNITDSSSATYGSLQSPNENVLTAEGTDLSAGSETITGVFLYYRLSQDNAVYNHTIKVYTDSQAETLLTFNNTNDLSFGWEYQHTLSEPSGGWSRSLVQALEVEITPSYITGSDYLHIMIVQLGVSEQ